jgi:hypothetical protein
MQIRIVLKSGYVQDFTCETFAVNKVDRQLSSLEHIQIEPFPLWLNLQEVAMIVQIEPKQAYR